MEKYEFSKYNKIYYDNWCKQPTNLDILENNFKKISLKEKKEKEFKSRLYYNKYYIRSLFLKLFFKDKFMDKGLYNLIGFKKIYNFHFYKLLDFDILNPSRNFISNYKKTGLKYKKSDIFEQSLRNLFVLNIIQLFKGEKISCTISFFSYNILY
ncbi:MAG: hypothetical protein ABF289_01635, partial [Clostridiales bacterium]